MMKLTKLPKIKKAKSAKKTKPLKKRKPVKKVTWFSKFRAWVSRTDSRQQQRLAVNVKADDTVRTCTNCGEVYKGRLCPQCGQAGAWTRYTWKQAMLNFLDIWGLGNRPMFRTIRELFWRPGYMVRDYLQGHRNFYFPPFKLLAVTVMLLFVVSKLAGVEQISFFKWPANLNLDEWTINDKNAADSGVLSGYMLSMIDAFVMFSKFLASNMLYEWLFIAAFAGVSIWIAFRHVSRFTFVETYIFLIFVLAQIMICDIPRAIGSGLNGIIEKQVLLYAGAGAVSAGTVFWSTLNLVSHIIGECYTLMFVALIVMDFHQFYGLKWKTTVKRLLITGILMTVLVLWTCLLFGVILVIEKSIYTWLALLILLLLPVSFVVADKYLTRNETLVPRVVRRVCKLSMLSVLMMIPMGYLMYDYSFNIYGACALVLLYDVLAVVISLLPVLLYKKFRNAWIACLPLVLTILLITCVVFSFHWPKMPFHTA